MRIGLVQLDTVWEKPTDSKTRIERLLDSTQGRFDLLVFPEMTLTGFSMKRERATLSAEDHTFFKSLAARTSCFVVYGGVEEDQNRLMVVGPSGRRMGSYAKRHLFSHGGEKAVYRPGSGLLTLDLGGVEAGFAICYDLRFPYDFWAMAERCQMMIVIANWPESRREHWMALLRARAIENQVFIVGVNRVGRDPELAYSGDSSVHSPLGEILLQCGSKEGVYTIEIDPAEIAQVRSRFKFMADRLA
ncbi:nitrilase-related carbon-nitrogen hydrolase [Geothrix sp. 21YS21S-4]|uniref:nitrilase-related carbon-nitrogen hydrolase n=1 Tax=Geothrix sp. 21YS21S-4 TaxID=3068889 RepID=UPI0027B98185|nr:nitrilase-related carbon-nitrogen hydrolase [Geothrix sp. 21YS21S-4]